MQLPIHPCVTRVQFWIVNAASLSVSALIACEIVSVHQLDNVTTLLQRAQVPLVQAQQNAPQIQALVQRTAVGATRDPALKDLLAKYGITLREKPAPAGTVGAQISSAPPASVTTSSP